LIIISNNNQYVYCQPQSFQHITTNDGLSQNSVISITQDSFGFIYLATQDGLNRYDGTNFSVYEEFFKDTTRPNFSRLGKVYVDKKNSLWITTLDGQLKRKTEEAVDFELISGIQEASYVFHYTEDTYYIGSFSQGLFELTFDNDTVVINQVIKDITVNQIVEHQNVLYLATSKGIIKYTPNHSSILFPELQDFQVSKILFHDNKLVVSTYGHGVFQSDDLKIIYKLNLIPKDLNVQDILFDIEQRLWIATYGKGLFMLKDDILMSYFNEAQNENSINYNDILCIFEDANSNLWFGTDGGGVSFINSGQKDIYSITNRQLPVMYPVDVPRSISTDSKGNVWIGTSGKGLTVTNKDLSKCEHYSKELNNIQSNRIMALHHDSDDNLWIGTQGDGLLKINKNSKNAKQIDFIPCQTIWDIEAGEDDHLWICSRNNGLINLNTKRNSWVNYNLENSSITSNNIRVIQKGLSDHIVYLGSEEGYVIKFNMITKEFINLEFADQSTGAIKALCIHNDKLLIGTQKSGILIYDLLSGKKSKIDKTDGLKNNVIYSILPQNEEFVWVSSNLGISQLNMSAVDSDHRELVRQHFTKDNGLGCNEFNTGASHIDKNGNLYFGGIDGVYYFNPKYILKNTNAVDVLLLDLITTDSDGKHVSEIYNKNEIELDYRQRNFQIRYVAQDYDVKSNTKFKYKLDGINEEWISNEKNELVNFSNVPPGNYLFEVKASNNDGIWNQNSTAIRIQIIPAFWQTLWFKALGCSLIFFGIYNVYRFRISQIRRTSLLKERALRAESRALKAQMNPHFIFNSLNSIDNFIINNKPEIASDYLTKFSKLMRSILEFSNQEKISLAEELNNLSVYLKMEQLRFDQKFEYKINVENDIDIHNIFIPTMVVQPFVENSVWHGLIQKSSEGSIEIVIRKHNSNLQIDIIDDGIGRQKANEIKSKTATKRKSFGMKITHERMKLLQELEGKGASIQVNDLIDKNNIPSGTKVSIQFSSILV